MTNSEARYEWNLAKLVDQAPDSKHLDRLYNLAERLIDEACYCREITPPLFEIANSLEAAAATLCSTLDAV